MVYPKVKVRTESQNNQNTIPRHDWSSVLSLKDIQFLSFEESCFPVIEGQDVSSPAKARVPKAYVPSIVMPTVRASEESDMKNNCDPEDKQIKTVSIPRPRAVVSSPDNDAMIGNKNKIKTVQPSVLANHTSSTSRHARCKVIPTRDKRKEWI